MSTIKEQLAIDLESLKNFNRNIGHFETVMLVKCERVSESIKNVLTDLRELDEAQKDLVNYANAKLKEVRIVNVNMADAIAAKINRLEEQVSTTTRQLLTPATPIGRRVEQAQPRIGLPIVNNGLGNVVNMNAVSPVAPNVAVTARPINTQESSDHIVVRRPDGTPVIVSSPDSQTTRTQLISEGNIPVTRAALRDEQYENYYMDDDDDYDDGNDVESMIDDTVTTLQAELENGVIVEAYCEECGEDIELNEFHTLNKCPNCDRVVVGRSFVQA